MYDRMIPLTDDRGHLLVPSEEAHNPEPGSVVLTNGKYGTAWQRHFADGLWHSTRGGKAQPWSVMLRKRGLLLAYEAQPRPRQEQDAIAYQAGVA